MIDITEIKRRLANDAVAVCQMLLPGGRKEQQEWRAGSTAGEKGQSLGVHLSGAKAGIWQDFATGEGGDLLDLWCTVKGISLSEALKQARSHLGIEVPNFVGERPAYTRPPKPPAKRPEGLVLDYLREDRNLPESVITAFKVGADGDRIIFPFLLPSGELALAKARQAVKGADPKPTAANCEPILFGWQVVPEDAREIIITEGEIDAMSWLAYGRPAMSVPFGGGKGGKQNWIENEYDRLARFERIYLATDMDQPGDEAAEEIAQRLGRHRCYRVTMPRKDANECLVDGVPQHVMDETIQKAASLDPEGLRNATYYTEDVVALFYPQDGERVGYSTPYGKLGDKVCFRPAEVTLWTGASGAGKSQILSDCCVHWIGEGSRVCLSSLEMKPQQTLKRMVKQATNLDRPTPEFARNAVQFLGSGLLIYDRVGKSSVEGMLQVFDYARAKYGCDQFIIDSLMRLGVAGDDYTGQEKVIFQIVDWAIRANVHLHLVAHARKGERGQGAPETEDIKGAMEIGANAFNILSVWRNRRHEEEMKAAPEGSAERRDLEEQPGVILNVAKQRNGDFEGKIGLWFDQATYRYHSSHDRGMWTNRIYPIEHPRRVA